MYSRVTLVEIDTLRVTMDEALDLFKEQVLPGLREQDGYEGVFVLTTPEGKGLVLTLWESEEDAIAGDLYAAALPHFVTFFRAPPGRESYRVALGDTPALMEG
jgi:hypothetical protein